MTQSPRSPASLEDDDGAQYPQHDPRVVFDESCGDEHDERDGRSGSVGDVSRESVEADPGP